MKYILCALCLAASLQADSIPTDTTQIQDMTMTEREQRFAYHLTGDAVESFIMMNHDMRTRAMDLSESEKLSPNDAVMKTMSHKVPEAK